MLIRRRLQLFREAINNFVTTIGTQDHPTIIIHNEKLKYIDYSWEILENFASTFTVNGHAESIK